MLNIVIPMAGAGSRFANAGYKEPKPLIKIHGIPMIQVVINNLKPSIEHRFIFICQRSHISEFNLINQLKIMAPESEIIPVEGLTDGAACTVLAAKSIINTSDQLMIANSDQYIDTSIDHYLNQLNHQSLDGLIMTMTASDKKWSFVKLNTNNLVTRIVEKEVISNEATVGIYNYRSGNDFVAAAEEMIDENDHVNGEFYVAPVYNYLIAKGKRVGISNIGSEGVGMYGLGTPSDLDAFLCNPISRTIHQT